MMLKLKFCVLIIFCSEINSQNTCGVPKIGQGNIFGGKNVTHGQYPWMSVIMRREIKNKFNFICGGSLISNKNVLTAAHCILESHTPNLPRDIRVMLGMFDLEDNYELERELIQAVKIHIHDDWNPSSVRFDADIAMIELEREVHISTYIQPVCLWTSSSDPSSANGIVVGYGRSQDKSKDHENLPKVVEVPIHTQEDCFLENSKLVALSSKRTFCGGKGDGSGVCSGDSGGGLFIKVSGVSYLRGIVSSSLLAEGQCDVHSYGIFTNVLKFSDWIKLRINPVGSFQQTIQTSIDRSTEMSTTKKPQTTLAPTAVQSYDECGVMSSSTGLIQGGKFSTLKDFPWLALIVLDQEKHRSGALVSHKHVVVSAYSFSYFIEATQKYVNAANNRIKIHFGALQKSTSRQAFDILKIVLHPQFRKVDISRINDVAVITLDRSVQFDEFVRPVCLWIYNDDLKWVANSQFYGVGYGKDETGKESNIKKHAKVALEDQQKCEKSYTALPNVLKETKTICIKADKLGAPCVYDFHIFMKYNDNWYLRGTFLRFFNTGNGTCDVDKPFLYEDNAQHSNWIQTQIDD